MLCSRPIYGERLTLTPHLRALVLILILLVLKHRRVLGHLRARTGEKVPPWQDSLRAISVQRGEGMGAGHGDGRGPAAYCPPSRSPAKGGGIAHRVCSKRVRGVWACSTACSVATLSSPFCDSHSYHIYRYYTCSLFPRTRIKKTSRKRRNFHLLKMERKALTETRGKLGVA